MPYTAKDQFHMKGMDTTMAYVGWIGTQGGRMPTESTEDLESELISQLDQLGAIPIAKFGCTALLFMKIAD
jgi:amidase